MNTNNTTIRPPVVAGMFYEDRSELLRAEIEHYLKKVTHIHHHGKLYGLVVPHAGYVYSGQTASYGYRMLQEHVVDSIVVLGPSHREYFNGASVYPGKAFKTPLGEYRIDEALRAALLKESSIVCASDVGHRAEHSVEVQVPFLQIVQPSTQFLPLVIGNQQREICEDLARALVAVSKGKTVVFIASSDLSHYHPQRKAVSIDSSTIDMMKKFTIDEWFGRFESGAIEACGGGAIGVVMMVAKELGANRCEVLHYATSGDVSGDYSGVVGYVAAAFLGE